MVKEMEDYLNSLQPGLAELADYVFYGNTKSSNVRVEDDFYRSGYNREHFLVEQRENFFG